MGTHAFTWPSRCWKRCGFGLSCGISEPDPTYMFWSCLFLGKDWARPALPLARNSCLPIWILEGQTLYLDAEVPRSRRWDGCACSKDPAEPRNSLLKLLKLLMFRWQQMVQSAPDSDSILYHSRFSMPQPLCWPWFQRGVWVSRGKTGLKTQSFLNSMTGLTKDHFSRVI